MFSGLFILNEDVTLAYTQEAFEKLLVDDLFFKSGYCCFSSELVKTVSSPGLLMGRGIVNTHQNKTACVTWEFTTVNDTKEILGFCVF